MVHGKLQGNWPSGSGGEDSFKLSFHRCLEAAYEI